MKKLVNSMPIQMKLAVSFIAVILFSFSLFGIAVSSVIKHSFEKNAVEDLQKTNHIIVDMIVSNINNNIETYLTTVAMKTRNSIEIEYNRYRKGEISEEQAYNFARRLILDPEYGKIGSTGYIGGVSDKGILVIHPVSEGVDASGFPFMQKAILMKNGFIEYEWKNKGETTYRSKVGGLSYFKPWNLMIWASSYKNECLDLIRIDDYKKMISKVKFGASGYTYVLNSSGDIIVHPELEGKNGINFRDAKGNLFIQEMCKTKNGQLIYEWKNLSDRRMRKKIVVYNYIPETDWIIASSAYYDDITGWIFSLIKLLLCIFIIVLGCSIIVSWFIAKAFSQPIIGLKKLFKEISLGNYNARAELHSTDEFGKLSQGFNDMAETLSQNRIDIDRYTSQLQEEKELLEVRVTQRTSDLVAVNEQLIHMGQIKSDFTSTVSHELRTPLTSILGFAKMIRKKQDEVLFPALDDSNVKISKAKMQVTSNVDIIISEGERLTNLINDVLDIAKMEAGKIEWKYETIHPEPLINRAVSATSSLFEKKKLPCSVSCSANIPHLIGDPDRLLQVLINLISNAVKFTDSGSITISALQFNTSIRFIITDTGEGIAPKYQSLIFEKFHQIGDVLSDKPTGTGLGLPICKEIVEHHGGSIWVESELGKGSSFIVDIPSTTVLELLPHEAIPQTIVKRVSATVTAELPVDDGRKCILVVDDEKSIRTLIRAELEDVGYRVVEAVDGLDAINKIKEFHPDVITLDIMMPNMNGFDVATKLKNDPQTAHIPIVVVTIVDDREHGIKIGVDRFFSKPIDTDQLIQAVGELATKTRTEE